MFTAVSGLSLLVPSKPRMGLGVSMSKYVYVPNPDWNKKTQSAPVTECRVEIPLSRREMADILEDIVDAFNTGDFRPLDAWKRDLRRQP